MSFRIRAPDMPANFVQDEICAPETALLNGGILRYLSLVKLNSHSQTLSVFLFFLFSQILEQYTPPHSPIELCFKFNSLNINSNSPDPPLPYRLSLTDLVFNLTLILLRCSPEPKDLIRPVTVEVVLSLTILYFLEAPQQQA